MTEKFVKVFFDTEFTSSGQNTDLVSIGLVSEKGETLYLELNDYDPRMITPWVQSNVLPRLQGIGISKAQGKNRVEQWFKEIAGENRIQLVSPGKEIDSILLYNLWGVTNGENPLRSWQETMPRHISHRNHLDMDTLFVLCGIDPDKDRGTLVSLKEKENRHHALYDALLLKECWDTIVEPKLLSVIS